MIHVSLCHLARIHGDSLDHEKKGRSLQQSPLEKNVGELSKGRMGKKSSHPIFLDNFIAWDFDDSECFMELIYIIII